jgi:hypothetical protein
MNDVEKGKIKGFDSQYKFMNNREEYGKVSQNNQNHQNYNNFHVNSRDSSSGDKMRLESINSNFAGQN